MTISNISSALRRIALSAIAALTLASCTNHGPIGPIYGIWATEAYDVDGQPQSPDLYDACFWRFQHDLVQISWQLPAHESLIWTGTFTRQADALTLDFAHISDPAFPTAMGLEPALMPMRILSSSPSRLILQYTPASAPTRTYTLRKL